MKRRTAALGVMNALAQYTGGNAQAEESSWAKEGHKFIDEHPELFIPKNTKIYYITPKGAKALKKLGKKGG